MECGKILWPEKGQEKGFERRYVGLESPQGQRYAALKSPRFPAFPTQIKASQHSREKNRLYLQVITFRKDPSLALKNLPITPNPTQ